MHELLADHTTVQTMQSEGLKSSEIVRTLSSVTKLNPMIIETSGYEFRKNSLNRLFPPSQIEQKKPITWEDL